ncbi:hypothetical protein [Motiliproteus sp. SC1-56]|uniref:hypothetical protein n=1 Tax=Motiliproteus sp. SC1-56 TaxID=2799565 RepID=UPI001A8F0CAE|nr:hypothetical protein [Motiliproteus sp. SC1-56]
MAIIKPVLRSCEASPARCLNCPLLALCCASSFAFAEPGVPFEGSREHATQFLHQYSLGYGLLYACGYSRLPAFMFNYQDPAELTLESAGPALSPGLVRLIVDMHDDQALYQRTCDRQGLLAASFAEPELSSGLIEGLAELDPEASAQNAFETGVYYRIRGEVDGFEAYLEAWHRALDEFDIASSDP